MIVGIKENIKKSEYYKNYLSADDLVSINNNFEKYALENNIKDLPIFKSLQGHVAKRIKYFALKSSCRRLAEICFSEDDNRHGIQMDGRDLKRWAALQMNELFEDKALIDNEYWHEY